MKLFEISTEFENVPYGNNEEKLKHLFRIQQAKCHIINVFILNLAHKYPIWWEHVGRQFWGNIPTKEWDRSTYEDCDVNNDYSWAPLPKPNSMVEASQIKRLFNDKYEDMQKAKVKFEQAGGKYPPYEK